MPAPTRSRAPSARPRTDHHPDRTDDDAARERFKALSAAYGVLGNPERRSRYDALRAATLEGGAARPGPGPRPRSGPAGAVGGRDRRPPAPAPDTRPLSVRALPQRRHGRWASIGGTALVVAGLLAVGLVAWLFAAGPDTTANGSDPDRPQHHPGLVAVKLVVVGIVFVVLGNRRRRHP